MNHRVYHRCIIVHHRVCHSVNHIVSEGSGLCADLHRGPLGVNHGLLNPAHGFILTPAGY